MTLSYMVNSHYCIVSVCSRLVHDICQQVLGMLTVGGCDMVSALYDISISKVANPRISSASLHKDPIAVLLTFYSPRKYLRMVWLLQACNYDQDT